MKESRLASFHIELLEGREAEKTSCRFFILTRIQTVKNDFMNYVGYRYSVIEEKAEECISAINRGDAQINIDRGDLTDDEIKYLKKIVERRTSCTLY